MIPEKIDRGLNKTDKNRYRTCCAVCHIKCGESIYSIQSNNIIVGTIFLGIMEAVVCVFVLLGVQHQIYWKHQPIDGCAKEYIFAIFL